MTFHSSIRTGVRLLAEFAALAAGLAGALVLASSAVGASPPAANCPPAAQPPSPDAVQAGLRNARDRGFLWKVVKDGRSSYLYGTVHVAKLDWVFPGPKTMQALNASDTVALELDLLDPALQRRMAEAIAARREPELPAALAQRLLHQAQAECIAPEILAGLGPMLQIATLSSLVGRRDGIDPAYGIDLFLAGLARAMDKKVVSLESAEAQIALLVSDDPAKVARTLDEGLRQLEGGQARKIIATLTRAWAEGQLETLRNYGDWCDCLKTAEDRADYARIVEGRNPALAAGIEAQHAAGHAVFAAVGVLHMVGPEGLPALMAAQGFRVTRVPHAAPGPRQGKPLNAPR